MTKNKGKKVLVTGAGGYIGCILIEELLSRGYGVKAVDAFYWGKEPLTKFSDEIEIVQTDIRDINPDLLEDVYAVTHFAGFSNDPMANYNLEGNYEVNTKSTKKLAEICVKSGIKKFTFASSASIYDHGLLASDNMQDEESEVSPAAGYSGSKFEAEKELFKLTNRNFKPVIFRQGTVYGFSPRMRFDLVVNTMLKSALSTGKINVLCGGEQWRPLIDVRDVARAHIAAIEADENIIGGQIYNLVYKNYRILELAHWISKSLVELKGIEPKIVVDYSPRQDRSYRISGEKVKRVLKWEPKISVEESVKDMIKKFDEYGMVDFSHPRYYNIQWMKMLVEIAETLRKVKRVF